MVNYVRLVFLNITNLSENSSWAMFSSETSHGRSWQDSSPPSIGKRQELASDQDDTSSATVTQEFSSQ